MREPMYPEMGERPEFLGRTVEEIMRAYASGSRWERQAERWTEVPQLPERENKGETERGRPGSDYPTSRGHACAGIDFE